jgi:hypothetical protein
MDSASSPASLPFALNLPTCPNCVGIGGYCPECGGTGVLGMARRDAYKDARKGGGRTPYLGVWMDR